MVAHHHSISAAVIAVCVLLALTGLFRQLRK
jgi:hypothetical protein